MQDILLVLGASSEVGSQYIQAYGDRYKLIYAHYNREVGQVLGELTTRTEGKIVLIQDDFNTDEGGERILSKIKEANIYPNCILHCAAPRIENVRFTKVKWEDFHKNLNIMVGATVRLLPKLFKHITNEKIKGYCTFILSSCTQGIPPKFETPYVTAKYALLGLMKSLSIDYSDHRIMVNGVSPGMMETKFLDNIFDHIVEENAQKSPFGRNLCIHEVLPMIDFLLSDKSERITGQNIIISGGM